MTKMTPCDDGNVLIPRLKISVPSAVVKGVLLGALVQLGCKSPTENQDQAILEFIKERYIFVSHSTGVGQSLCHANLPFIFYNILQ